MLEKIMKSLIEERIEETEHEYDKGFAERVGKVIIVGVVTLAVSMLVESQYDKFMDKRRERDTDV